MKQFYAIKTYKQYHRRDCPSCALSPRALGSTLFIILSL